MSDRAISFEDDTGTSQGLREIVFKEHLIFIPIPIDSGLISNRVVYQHLIITHDNEPIAKVNL